VYRNILRKHTQNLFQCFLSNFSPRKKEFCLDVGGVSRGFEGLPTYCNCISINLHAKTKKAGWAFILADAACLPFTQYSVDYVISNSVIEHLDKGVKAYSKEIRRVSKTGYFISCPYYYTILEPHYFVPFFQFLPERVKKALLFKFSLRIGHMSRKNYEVITIPSPKTLRLLFPEATCKKLMLFGLPWDVIITSRKTDS
jgi:hypothetical protein